MTQPTWSIPSTDCILPPLSHAAPDVSDSSDADAAARRPALKLCFSTLACPDWTLRQIVDGARSAGIDGVDFRGLGREIDITQLPAFGSELDQTLALLRGAGLSLPCLNTSVTLVTPAPERWRMMLDECQRYARLAAHAGTPCLRVFGGAAPKGMTTDEARILARRHLRQLVKVCESVRSNTSARAACVPVVETHDQWDTASRVMELLEGFDPAEAGVLWDVEHPFRRGEAPADTARLLRPFLRHTHFKDAIRQPLPKPDGTDMASTASASVKELVPPPFKYLPRLLGEGDLPLLACLKELRSIGYGGWYCLEAEKRWHLQECPEPEETIPQFAQFMRWAWDSL